MEAQVAGPINLRSADTLLQAAGVLEASAKKQWWTSRLSPAAIRSSLWRLEISGPFEDLYIPHG
jgi:hypothetical protein